MTKMKIQQQVLQPAKWNIKPLGQTQIATKYLSANVHSSSKEFPPDKARNRRLSSAGGS